MSRIVLSTTSSCLEELNVPHKLEFIRFTVTVNNVEFIDGKNINHERLCDIMLKSPAAPSSTAATPVDELLAMFDSLAARGYKEVFVVAISSQVSKTVEHLQAAKAQYTGNMELYIYDSKSMTIPEGMLAFEADQLFRQGMPAEAVAARLNEIRINSLSYITVSKLDYLIANKKLSAPAGFFASLFDIKPVIALTQSGRLVPVKKIRKIENAIGYMAEKIYQFKQQYRDAYVYVLVSGDPVLNDYTLKLLAQKYGIANIPVLSTSSITLANHGPHMVGIGGFHGERPLLTKYL